MKFRLKRICTYCMIAFFILGCGSYVKERAFRVDYLNMSYALDNYYLSRAYSFRVTGFDSLDRSNSHALAALNNYLLILNHRIIYHDRFYDRLPHWAYDFTEISEKKMFWYFGSPLIDVGQYYSKDYSFLPFFTKKSFEEKFSGINSYELKNRLDKGYLISYELKHRSYNAWGGLDSSLNAVPMTGYAEYRPGVRREELFALILDNQQYYLTSWFYGYRHSCLILYYQEFLPLLKTIEEWKKLGIIDPKTYYQDKRTDVNFEREINPHDRKLKNQRSGHDRRPQRKQQIKWNQHQWERYAEEMSKNNSLLFDYFSIILEIDYQPEDLVYLSKKRKYKHWGELNQFSSSSEQHAVPNGVTSRNGVGIELKFKFYSKELDKNCLLTFDIGQPYFFNIELL